MGQSKSTSNNNSKLNDAPYIDSFGKTEVSNEIYNDDDALIEAVKTEKKEAKIDLEIRAQRSMIKLKEKVDLPAMVSIKTSGGVRSSVDLICVIDVSGSMSGQKINLVKSTMKYLLESLTASDRLAIITFNSSGRRICGLKNVSAQNLVNLNQHVDSLTANGGTNINSGLDLALKTINERKVANKVTSIFLLSDGQDRGAEVLFAKTLSLSKNKELGVFSIHSFGFGTDHDEDLMTKLCALKDGNFYFIKELGTLDEAFANALGGIISIVAKDLVLKINNVSKNIVQGIKIKKVFGSMWQKMNQNQYKIKVLQLMSGISKDYVFQIGVPSIDTEVGDLDRNHDIIQVIYQAKGMSGQNLTGQFCLKITLINENEQILQMNQSADVVQNYLRIKAAEAIEENMKKAQENKYEEAQQGIDSIINDIRTNKRARQDKMEGLVNDLQVIRQKCQREVYQTQGRKQMMRAHVEHEKQVSYNYANCVQKQMVSDRKAKKGGFFS